MCDELEALGQSIVGFASGFDARSLTPAQAATVVRACTRIESSVASVKALAAARAAQGSSWKHEGYRSPADQLAHQAGMSPSSARRSLETGKRMTDQPDVARAALSGQLSIEQAAAVSDGVAADPAKSKELIEKAGHASLSEINREVARIKANNSDPEARHRARHAKRFFRRWTDREGALQAHLYGHPEDGARLWRMLDPLRRNLILRRRGHVPNEPLEALDYDAVMAIAAIAAGHEDGEINLDDLLELGLFPQLDRSRLGNRGQDEPSTPTPSLFPLPQPAPPDDAGREPSSTSAQPGRRGKVAGSPARILVRVDLDTLLRGVPTEGETCEIAGYGPVPVSVIEELATREATFIAGVLTKGQQVLSVYHYGRRYPTAHQKSALDWLYPTCAATGCSATAGLQTDHREDYARTGYTVLDLLDRLCPHHHRLKTNKGWALVHGCGKRAFVAPHDPRHPHHTPDPPPA